jgi:galactonate dehydratase
MKITEVKTSSMRGVGRNWLFVKLETDEGIHGWGEGTLEGQEKTVEQAVQMLAPRLIGQDPTPIERHWQILYRHGFWRGGVVLNSALSALDQALWDIQGKALGAPVYRLLGGPVRDRVRAYTHFSTPDQAGELVKKGFTAMKTGGWYANEGIEERDAPSRLRERIAAARDAVGPNVDIMIDNHGRSRPAVAIRQIRAVEEFRLLFFEEAVPPDNLDAMAQVRRESIQIDLATGERLYTRWGFKDLIERQLVDVIQPDICHAGGISELRRIAAMAETYYIQVAPHNPNGPIATAASVHLCAAIPNFLILEHAQSHPWHDKVQLEPLKLVNGYFELPTAPGLGVELDEELIASRPYEPLPRGGAFYADGGVADV